MQSVFPAFLVLTVCSSFFGNVHHLYELQYNKETRLISSVRDDEQAGTMILYCR